MALFRSRFQAAPVRAASKNLGISVVSWGCLLLVWGIAFPWALHRLTLFLQLKDNRFSVPIWLSVGVAALGALGSLWAVVVLASYGRGTPWYGACPRRLVVAGPYRYLRYPQMLGLLISGCGPGLYLGNWWLLLPPWLLMGFWHAVLRPSEEADLEQRFRVDYRQYQQSVPGWWPRLTPYPLNPK